MLRTLALASLVLTVWGANRAPALTLVENGNPRAIIVVEDQANEFHLTAARDLQEHLRLISGAEIPIVDAAAARGADSATVRLIVGASKLSRALGVGNEGMEKEAYRIRTSGNNIVFLGEDITRSSNATAWAVGYFLDRELGVRWLWPGELGTHAPARKTITVPDLDITGRPQLEQRRLRSRGTGATADWLRHHEMGSRMSFSFGHAFTDWWPKYHEAHPDYFAVPPAGEKQPYPQPDRVKLRIGNPAVGDQILENWRAAGRPDNWNVCPNDGSGWDTSAESRALDLPDVFEPQAIWRNKANLTRRFVRFWNGLLVRMRKENPRVTISTYAYSCYREAPADMKLEPGMVVGIVDTYASTRIWQAWNAAGARLILRPNWWHVGGSGPHLPLHLQGESFRYAQTHAMIGFDFDSLMGHWGNQGALYYLIARLSTRLDLSVDQVIAEYTGAFGAAAPVIREYLAYWEDYAAKVATPVTAGGDVSQNPNGLFETLARKYGKTGSTLGTSWSMMPYIYTDEVIAPGVAILDRAAKAAANDTPLAKKRVAYLRTALELLKEHREVIRLADKKARRPAETDRDLVAQMNRLEARQKDAVRDYGVIGFTETIPSRLRITDPRKMEGL
ncbi:MAG: DUF4838 domain-containing protein [Opitutaceae bacterium]|nr:DUF4838 domain-containing protein [Opitutaceae bacterium]